MPDLSGRTLGKYQLQTRLGQGGMAEVYQAWHPTLERHVAVKVLHAHLAQDAGFLIRFQREAKAVAQLQHPHIVQVFDFDYDAPSEIYYMVMEHIAGPTLKTVLDEAFERGDRLPLPQVLQIMAGLLEAVGYAHTQGMVHRDLKPSNILFRTASPPPPGPPARGGVGRGGAGGDDSQDPALGQVVLTDFGIARLLGNDRLTHTGATVGTPTYLSPEQAMGSEGDARSDLYALGIILYECLCGQTPFDAANAAAILHKHIHAPIPSLRTTLPNLPAALDDVLAKALAKRPEDRFQTAAEMRTALETLDQTAAHPTRVDSRIHPLAPSRPRAPALPRTPAQILVVLALVMLVGLAGVLIIPPLLGPAPAQRAIATAQSQSVQGDYQLAIDAYGLALTAEPDNIVALLGRAWAAEAQGLVDEALADYARVLALDPNNATAHAESTRMKLQYATEAFAPVAWLADLDFAVAQATAAERPRIHYLRGWAIFTFALVDGVPNPNAALADLQTAVTLAPQNAEYQFTLAQVWLALDNPAEALAAANRAVELAPQVMVHYKLRAHVQFSLGDHFAALDDLTTALQYELDNAALATVYAERAYLQHLVGLPESAQASVAQALQLYPDSVLASYVQFILDPTSAPPASPLAEVPDDPIWQAIVGALE